MKAKRFAVVVVLVGVLSFVVLALPHLAAGASVGVAAREADVSRQIATDAALAQTSVFTASVDVNALIREIHRHDEQMTSYVVAAARSGDVAQSVASVADSVEDSFQGIGLLGIAAAMVAVVFLVGNRKDRPNP